MNQATTIQYYVRWEDWAETIPLSLYRMIMDKKGRPEDEQVWNKTDQIWERTTRVTESMFRGGDIEPTTAAFAKQHFPKAFQD
jgi:hypothetical protein